MSDIIIPIPLAPEDRDLPISCVRLKLQSGGIFEMNIPLQGRKTINNTIATLELWKDTLVVKTDFEI